MTTEPNPTELPWPVDGDPVELPPEASEDDTVKRSWADELWYGALPYRGRP